ncbi:MAG: carbohydrate ABC transporter permease [Clostridia bacterium]|nr:carbohydrate ABC transporter permease [Clostridia bacterium]
MNLETRGEKIFKVFNYILLSLISLITLYPVVYVISASLSSPAAVLAGRVAIWPVELTLDSYKILLKDADIYRAYANTIFYTGVGTLISITLEVLMAYPLSKKRLFGRSGISMGLAFSMWISAGMIPLYLVIKSLGLLNSRMGLLIPFACSAYHIILLRTFFQSLPEAFEEYAKIEGAGDWRILTSIYIPLSKAAIATVILYIAVGKWNSYFWAMTILRDDSKMPLQVLLKNMVVQMSVSTSGDSAGGATNLSQETMVYSTMVIAMVPMLILYPFIQKYFVKGVMVGGVKG